MAMANKASNEKWNFFCNLFDIKSNIRMNCLNNYQRDKAEDDTYQRKLDQLIILINNTHFSYCESS